MGIINLSYIILFHGVNSRTEFNHKSRITDTLHFFKMKRKAYLLLVCIIAYGGGSWERFLQFLLRSPLW